MKIMRRGGSPWLAAFIIVLAAAAGAQTAAYGKADAESKPWGWYPDTTTVPEKYILFNETTLDVLDRVATPGRRREQRAVLFTTLRFGDLPTDLVMGMISTFCYHLEIQGMLQHTMLITTDEATWHILHERGFPAFLDRAFNRRPIYIDRVEVRPETDNREFDIEKHWWGWRFASLGYRVIYMDSDAVVLRNPMLPFQHSYGYDVQGLSDWEDLQHPDVGLGGLISRPCSLYLIKGDDTLPTKSFWTEWWTLQRLNTGEAAFLAQNPCQSTGIWYLEPNERTVAFMQALVDRIAYHKVEEWDQTGWNDIIQYFLFGAGDHPPLKYRVLPFSEFANIGTHRARRDQGFSDDPIVLHLGGVHGEDKKRDWEQEGFWQAEFRWERQEGGGRLSLAGMPAAVAGGWAWLVLVVVAAIGSVYYWRAKRMSASEHGSVISVQEMRPIVGDPASPNEV